MAESYPDATLGPAVVTSVSEQGEIHVGLR